MMMTQDDQKEDIQDKNRNKRKLINILKRKK